MLSPLVRLLVPPRDPQLLLAMLAPPVPLMLLALGLGRLAARPREAASFAIALARARTRGEEREMAKLKRLSSAEVFGVRSDGVGHAALPNSQSTPHQQQRARDAGTPRATLWLFSAWGRPLLGVAAAGSERVLFLPLSERVQQRISSDIPAQLQEEARGGWTQAWTAVRAEAAANNDAESNSLVSARSRRASSPRAASPSASLAELSAALPQCTICFLPLLPLAHFRAQLGAAAAAPPPPMQWPGACTTPCGHVFHRQCLLDWVRAQRQRALAEMEGVNARLRRMEPRVDADAAVDSASDAAVVSVWQSRGEDESHASHARRLEWRSSGVWLSDGDAEDNGEGEGGGDGVENEGAENGSEVAEVESAEIEAAEAVDFNDEFGEMLGYGVVEEDSGGEDSGVTGEGTGNNAEVDGELGSGASGARGAALGGDDDGAGAVRVHSEGGDALDSSTEQEEQEEGKSDALSGEESDGSDVEGWVQQHAWMVARSAWRRHMRRALSRREESAAAAASAGNAVGAVGVMENLGGERAAGQWSAADAAASRLVARERRRARDASGSRRSARHREASSDASDSDWETSLSVSGSEGGVSVSAVEGAGDEACAGTCPMCRQALPAVRGEEEEEETTTVRVSGWRGLYCVWRAMQE